jgi:rSAM/selenodomain-associated transferase 1
MVRRHLILFLRVPRLGQGKRRLARDVGDLAAVRFERLMIARLLRRLGRDRRWRLVVALTPDHLRLGLRHCRRPATIGQGKGDLGQRMQRAIAARPPGPAILVGADIPGLAAAHIAIAFGALGDHDVVFGPAEDGGFWLVGARRSPRLPRLFDRVRWSSPETLADTLAALDTRLRVALAARLEDVDDGPGYRRLSPRRGF